jgi:hypothetical protein
MYMLLYRVQAEKCYFTTFSHQVPLCYNTSIQSHFLSLWGASCCVTYICYTRINILQKNYTYAIRKRNLTTSLLFQKIVLMLDDRRFYVEVLWSGCSDSYDEKIIILERTNFICILCKNFVCILCNANVKCCVF